MSEASKRLEISAVIPAFNRERTIARAIESALAQEYAPSEIIVVDDGSTDGTREIVRRYGARVRYDYQANRGVSSARNVGVVNATSEWIAFLDSDDYWKPDHLRKMAEAIEGTNREGTLYFGNAIWQSTDRETSYWDLCKFRIDGGWQLKRDAIEWAFMNRQPMLLQSSVVKRSRYIDVGMLPEGLIVQEDTLLFYRFSLLETICAVSECGAVLGHDYSSERLTAMYSSRTSSYWNCSVAVFRDLINYRDRMSLSWKIAVKDGLIASYISLARALFREGRVGTSFSSVATALILGPGRSAGKLFLYLFAFIKNRLTNGKAVESLARGRR
jgi:glycosyltransferase involved in cell wall biosynthesis